MPRTLFKTEDGPDFEFDGRASSVVAMSNMLVEVFARAKSLLHDDILFGLTDQELGVNIDRGEFFDQLANDTNGYGFISQPGISKEMEVLKVLMKHPDFQGVFYNRFGGEIKFCPTPCKRWLTKVQEFKELIYVLLHFLSGMPKRGSEERLQKLCNTPERFRNICWMLQALTFVGNYAKTSANSGGDRVTLHVSPTSVTDLILRFFVLAFGIEKRLISEIYPERNVMYQSYLYTGHGLIWAESRFSDILKRETGRYMGLELGISAIRQLMPAIAEHYQLGIDSTAHSVLHFQQGHGSKVGGELYARVKGMHPHLTSAMVRDVMKFCLAWQALLGFSDDTPRPMSADDMYRVTFGYQVHERESALVTAVKELVSKLQMVLSGELLRTELPAAQAGIDSLSAMVQSRTTTTRPNTQSTSTASQVPLPKRSTASMASTNTSSLGEPGSQQPAPPMASPLPHQVTAHDVHRSRNSEVDNSETAGPSAIPSYLPRAAKHARQSSGEQDSHISLQTQPGSSVRDAFEYIDEISYHGR